MVFFTCNICGESVKKPAVEKHYLTRCRGNNKNVSCMDCLKDFYNQEYVAHTKCISEAQKYSSQSHKVEETTTKNEQKQESWMDIIRAILNSTEYQFSQQVREVFERLQRVDNVPRKKAKFENFVSNCMRMNRHQASEVWQVLEKELNKMKDAKQAELAAIKAAKQNGATNGKSKPDEEAPAAKKKKQENGTACAAEAVEEQAVSEDFDWQTHMNKIVGKQADEGIFMEKLKKKLLKKYSKHLAVQELSEKQSKKFNKRFDKQLKKCASLQLQGDLVKQC